MVCSSSNTRDDPASLGAHRLDSRTKVGRPSKIRTNADIRARFRLEFKTPPFERKDEIRAASVTRKYALVGTAFDYYLRFRIKRLNPQAVERTWIAEDRGEYTWPTRPFLSTLAPSDTQFHRRNAGFPAASPNNERSVANWPSRNRSAPRALANQLSGASRKPPSGRPATRSRTARESEERTTTHRRAPR